MGCSAEDKALEAWADEIDRRFQVLEQYNRMLLGRIQILEEEHGKAKPVSRKRRNGSLKTH